MMAFDRIGMLFAIIDNDAKKVERILKNSPEARLNEHADGFFIPLYRAVDKLGNPHKTERHQCQILLLAAGANPFQSATKTCLETPFSRALDYEDLLALRLMLISKPPIASEWKTNVQLLRETRERIVKRGENSLNFLECLKVTAKNAWKIHHHKEQATQYVASNNNLTAAAAEYEKAVALYAEEIKLEAELIYPPLPDYLCKPEDDPIEKSRPIAIAYYEKKQKECLKQLYTWYQIIDEILRTKSAVLSPEAQQYHIEVLDRWIMIGRKLDLDVSQGFHDLEQWCLARNLPLKTIASPPKPPEDIDTFLPTENILQYIENRNAESDAINSRPKRSSSALTWLSQWLGLDKGYEEIKDKDR